MVFLTFCLLYLYIALLFTYSIAFDAFADSLNERSFFYVAFYDLLTYFFLVAFFLHRQFFRIHKSFQ